MGEKKLLSQLKSHEPPKKRVYKLLKEPILNGDLEPGKKLSQDWLAKQMKVSRIPMQYMLLILHGNSQTQGIL